MSDPGVQLSREESMGDDSPAVSARVTQWAARHRALTAVVLVLALVLASVGVALWWQRRPAPVVAGPFDSVPVSVSSTGMGGVVFSLTNSMDASPSGGEEWTAVLGLETKVTVGAGATGHVVGFAGPGIRATDAHGIPEVLESSSAVGVVTSTVSCGEAQSGEPSSLVITLSDGERSQTREVPLGEMQPEWSALVTKGCQIT